MNPGQRGCSWRVARRGDSMVFVAPLRPESAVRLISQIPSCQRPL